MSLVPNISFTVRAADKVASLLEEEQNPHLHLRVYVTGGGCSGFQYGFSFDETMQEDDTVIVQQCSAAYTANSEIKEVKVVIDSLSYPYLKEAEIDYEDKLQGSQFVIRNPNAQTTCGCGSSFSLGDDDE
jgi:iron-sulfur cluster insertion protein